MATSSRSSPWPASPWTTSIILLVCALAGTTNGHDHHFEGSKGNFISEEPIDAILWIHILVQTFAWGILFPTGMVLGITRSRWHVPVQVLGTGLAVLGWFLGHMHKGRQFTPSAHGHFAKWLMLMLIVQVGLGVYLRFHIERGFLGRIRKLLVLAHGVVGKALPVAAWVQMLFGGIAALGFCHDDHMGQCLAHFIMGSAFIAYGILLTILLLVGQAWLRRTNRSQEFFDSLVIAAWGCVNTFTEHRWGQEWAHNDIQHTSMGVIWWCAGLLGMWLSRTRSGRPKRNLIPGLTILLTGYAMSAHPQHLMVSTMVHSIFGYTLMAAGLTRMIEIAFVLRDAPTLDESGDEPNSFQHLTPFLLFAAGFMFMGATEEQMALLDQSGMDHVSYFMILYSIAFLLYLFVNMLLHLYSVSAQPAHIKLDPEDGHARAAANGYLHVNGTANGHADAARAREAEEFELHGLTSDDEDDGDDRPLVHKEMQRAD